MNTGTKNKTIISQDLESKTLEITREFHGRPDLVWKAWTSPELLDQWWAPRPWKAVTQAMDFREGGTWLYYMSGPQGEQNWCRADYKKIIPQEYFKYEDAFCDSKGEINADHPRMSWKVEFSESVEGTRVKVSIAFSSVEALETIVRMGFKQGFTMAHGNLDELLTNLSHGNHK